jgi:hypothetical protein
MFALDGGRRRRCSEFVERAAIDAGTNRPDDEQYRKTPGNA